MRTVFISLCIVVTMMTLQVNLASSVPQSGNIFHLRKQSYLLPWLLSNITSHAPATRQLGHDSDVYTHHPGGQEALTRPTHQEGCYVSSLSPARGGSSAGARSLSRRERRPCRATDHRRAATQPVLINRSQT